jgi:alkylation response protein AidB-like acyl-CoA dehydrogenase
MDFTLPPEIEDIRLRTRRFVEEHVLPLEAARTNYDEHENIRLDVLRDVQAKARAEGLWAPQAPKAYGGMALPIVGWAAMYEEANRSIFGPLAFNCAAPDDGNMNVLALVGTPAQKDKWLRPIIDGKVRSSFAMTEPAPGGGSAPARRRKATPGWSRATSGSSRAPASPSISSWSRVPRTISGAGSRLSSFTATSPGGASCAGSRSWGRRNMAVTASLPLKASRYRTRTC